jgi:hypothetical protein
LELEFWSAAVPAALGSVLLFGVAVPFTSDEVPVVVVALDPGVVAPVWSVAAPFWSTVVLEEEALLFGTAVVLPVVEVEVDEEPAAFGVVFIVPVVELPVPTPFWSVWLLTPGVVVVLVPAAFGVVLVVPWVAEVVPCVAVVLPVLFASGVVEVVPVVVLGMVLDWSLGVVVEVPEASGLVPGVVVVLGEVVLGDVVVWLCDIVPVVPVLVLDVPVPVVCADATPRQSNNAAVIPSAFIIWFPPTFLWTEPVLEL